MTLIKSILLGTAAGMVVVSGAAQAADLPTRKAAPAQDYVKICNVAGQAGFIIPGSDTCLKISGFVLALYSGGNIKNQYILNDAGTAYTTINPSSGRDALDMSARSALSIDTALNTAYGPLVTSFQFRGNTGSATNGVNNAAGSGFAIDHGYIQWAGITAGYKGSFYDVFGEGNLWDDYYAPDNLNRNPILLAYTATFGGGFSATISLEDNYASRANTDFTAGEANVYHGVQYPDIVGVIDLKQGWGEAAIAGVAHNTDVIAGADGGSINKWGYGVNAGVKFNLPGFSGDPKNPDTITFQGDWTKGALGFSGYSAGNVLENGNGTAFNFLDQMEYAPGLWAEPTAWAVAGNIFHRFSPQFAFSPEISYLSIDYGSGPTDVSTKLTSWKGGAIAHWYPLASSALDFHIEAMYTRTKESTPAAFVGSALQPTFVGTSDGFIVRAGVERDF
jgi:hypothetical protein